MITEYAERPAVAGYGESFIVEIRVFSLQNHIFVVCFFVSERKLKTLDYV